MIEQKSETKLDLRKVVLNKLAAIGFSDIPEEVRENVLADVSAKLEQTVASAVKPALVGKFFNAYVAQKAKAPAKVAAPPGAKVPAGAAK